MYMEKSEKLVCNISYCSPYCVLLYRVSAINAIGA